jgi:GDP-L-fucose synthase
MPVSETLVLGSTGLVGGAIVDALTTAKTHFIAPTGVDLRCREQCETLFASVRPRQVFLAAAHVGGIVANTVDPVGFLADNAEIAINVLRCAHAYDVERLLNLGSSCIYPRDAKQPIQESSLLSGPLEPTNQPYALAKIMAIELCDAYRRQYGRRYISVMPCNLYGENDNFHQRDSHVVPALIRRFVDAVDNREPSVTLWGDGHPRRELMHVCDLASACMLLMEHHDASGPINVGTGSDITIRELASLTARLVGYNGAIRWDATMPTGTPQKLLDVSKIRARGWSSTVSLEEGLARVIASVRHRRAVGLPIRGWQ